MKHLPLLTTSAATAYRTCPRFFFWTYEQQVRPVHHNDAIEFGTLGHRGLEAYWKARKTHPTQPDRWLSDALAEVGHPDEYVYVAQQALLIGYATRWLDDGLQTIAVEREYVTPLTNPATGAASRTFQQAGKIDVLCFDADGNAFVLDHKYTRTDFSPGSDYRQALLLNSQVSNYLAGAHSLDVEPKGWIHDVIARPALRPLKATPLEARKYTKEKRDKSGVVTEPSRLYAGQREHDETPEEYFCRLTDDIAANPDKYYARFVVVRLEEEVREAAFDMWQVAAQIRDSQNANAWPRNPSSCLRYGRACEMLPLCTGQASPDDATRYRRAARAHEELGVEMSDESKERAA